MLNAEDIYRTLSEILVDEKNCHFASVMVETLSTLLLTSSELFPLRRKLKDLASKVCARRSVSIDLLTLSFSTAALMVDLIAPSQITGSFVCLLFD